MWQANLKNNSTQTIHHNTKWYTNQILNCTKYAVLKCNTFQRSLQPSFNS